ncbi:hypothetical protein Mmc1_2131 [Magnetococcus marinus MC-1]|uniref:Uncharacterized protein n=1 Tax=Magnetococcus marinus (strain ATCC BAA-1437 / JCM 17883 / MC-1) TaxID=156889 RepID=A0L9I9_MAGMM|nr:hypothetical protein [Magnetococcus marinus]ABK44632.1 hypothetical protein Mmc1_2131 [Magnetococcus marinus MC-1]
MENATQTGQVEQSKGIKFLKIGVLVGGVAILLMSIALVVMVVQKKSTSQVASAPLHAQPMAPSSQTPEQARLGQSPTTQTSPLQISLPPGGKMAQIATTPAGLAVWVSTPEGGEMLMLDARGALLQRVQFTREAPHALP